jgi:glycosyltransferase involved in cell wall biosynthesis
MKVLYDHQVFEYQNIGGISRYFVELIKHNPTARLSLRYSDNVYLNDMYFKKYNLLPIDYGYDDFMQKYSFRGKKRLFHFYNRFFKGNKTNLELSMEKIKDSDFDVFHPTYYNPYFLKYLGTKPFVLTVHDMIHELFPKYFSLDDVAIVNKKKLIHKANKIIAISENTRQDILKFYPEAENKIKVIYHCFSSTILVNDKKKENYLLFTGSRSGYKNFDLFVQAVAPLLLQYNINLVCTGYGFSQQEIDLFEGLHIADKVTCQFVTDEVLSELYTKAIAFVFPSLYEGFGFPVLEAFAAGCPAILSNTSSLLEIGGEAAIYFDPYSIQNMRSTIEKVLTSPSLQEQLSCKGKNQIKKFSWEKTANQTYNVYQEATGFAI